MKRVAPLDLENPEQDFERWSLAVLEIARRAGHGALEAPLLTAVGVPPPPAAADPLADTLVSRCRSRNTGRQQEPRPCTRRTYSYLY